MADLVCVRFTQSTYSVASTTAWYFQVLARTPDPLKQSDAIFRALQLGVLDQLLALLGRDAYLKLVEIWPIDTVWFVRSRVYLDQVGGIFFRTGLQAHLAIAIEMRAIHAGRARCATTLLRGADANEINGNSLSPDYRAELAAAIVTPLSAPITTTEFGGTSIELRMPVGSGLSRAFVKPSQINCRQRLASSRRVNSRTDTVRPRTVP